MQTLKKRADFVKLNQLKQSWITPGFILQAAQRNDNKETGQHIDRSFCIGFTASRKIGNAVKRNFAKRRMRALTHQVLTLYALDQHDYVLIARPAILTIQFEELKQDLVKATKLLHKKYELK